MKFSIEMTWRTTGSAERFRTSDGAADAQIECFGRNMKFPIEMTLRTIGSAERFRTSGGEADAQIEWLRITNQ